MGLFSREKITMNELASTIAKSVFEHQLKNIEIYSKLFKDSDIEFNINEKQKEEILIFDMFVVVRSFQLVMEINPETNYILDKFHENIYNALSDDNEILYKFEEKVQNRYVVYNEKLSSQDKDVMLNFGMQFSRYFFNNKKDDMGLLLAITSANIMIESIKILKKMITEILSNYELIK